MAVPSHRGTLADDCAPLLSVPAGAKRRGAADAPLLSKATRDPVVVNDIVRNTSRFKGVSWEQLKGKWKVRIRKDGKYTHIAYCADEEEAARLWDAVALQLHGPIFRPFLNFPNGEISASMHAHAAKAASAASGVMTAGGAGAAAAAPSSGRARAVPTWSMSMSSSSPRTPYHLPQTVVSAAAASHIPELHMTSDAASAAASSVEREGAGGESAGESSPLVAAAPGKAEGSASGNLGGAAARFHPSSSSSSSNHSRHSHQYHATHANASAEHESGGSYLVDPRTVAFFLRHGHGQGQWQGHGTHLFTSGDSGTSEEESGTTRFSSFPSSAHSGGARATGTKRHRSQGPPLVSGGSPAAAAFAAAAANDPLHARSRASAAAGGGADFGVAAGSSMYYTAYSGGWNGSHAAQEAFVGAKGVETGDDEEDEEEEEEEARQAGSTDADAAHAAAHGYAYSAPVLVMQHQQQQSAPGYFVYYAAAQPLPPSSWSSGATPQGTTAWYVPAHALAAASQPHAAIPHLYYAAAPAGAIYARTEEGVAAHQHQQQQHHLHHRAHEYEHHGAERGASDDGDDGDSYSHSCAASTSASSRASPSRSIALETAEAAAAAAMAAAAEAAHPHHHQSGTAVATTTTRVYNDDEAEAAATVAALHPFARRVRGRHSGATETDDHDANNKAASAQAHEPHAHSATRREEGARLFLPSAHLRGASRWAAPSYPQQKHQLHLHSDQAAGGPAARSTATMTASTTSVASSRAPSSVASAEAEYFDSVASSSDADEGSGRSGAGEGGGEAAAAGMLVQGAPKTYGGNGGSGMSAKTGASAAPEDPSLATVAVPA